MSGSFEDAYAKLNPRQKEAVDAIEGPVMVIAGPGTGKTQILTLRIANILRRTDLPPGAILALTFTEAAAANMRRRLVELTGDARAYYVHIATFHGFANDLIQQYPEYFPAIIGARNAAEVDQIQLVRNTLAEREFAHLKPFGDAYFYVPDILGAIRSVKNEGLSPAEFLGLVDAKEAELRSRPDLYHEKGRYAGRLKGEYEKAFASLERNRELAAIYAEYEERLRAARLYDFEDMILGVIKAFESRPDFLLQAQERFQYFLVDEHQDTNGAQNRLLELLASYYDNPNLFVVGDEKQAIFRFQGASLENFLYFRNRYPEAKLVYLEENYRSYQSILDSAGSLIEKNTAALKHDLAAVRREPERSLVRVIALRTAEVEAFAVSELVRERLAAGVMPEEIAILYRENREAAAFADMLARRGIAHAVESDRNVLEDPDLRNLFLLLEAIADFGNEERLAEALHLEFLHMEPLEIYKMIAAARAERRPLYELVAATPIGGKLAAWKKASINKNFLNFFEEILQDSGFLATLASRPRRLEKLGALTALWQEVRRIVGDRGDYRLADFIRHLDIVRAHHLPIKGPSGSGKGAVRLMTAHKAKGLEFDCVIIAGAVNGRWGNRRNPARFTLPFKTSVDAAVMEKNEDERRLFYMALTRARNEVYVTYPLERADGKAEVPSQFIGEIREDLRRELSGEPYERALEDQRFKLLVRQEERPPLAAEREFLQELFRKRGLSATALNNYLECPWRFFYVNLLRIPVTPTLTQVYGTAVHAALEAFFGARKQGQPADRDFLLDAFARALHRHPLVERDMSRLLEKGKHTLAAYHDHYAPLWNYRVVTELKIKVPFEKEVALRGILDKVELGDADGVVVVDYKTRMPQSRNWIEGKTADSTGDYKRQLVFYKLLLDASPQLGYRMREGVIDFVEPNERGAFKKEAFAIGDAEVGELRQTVSRVIEEISGLSFWNAGCGKAECRFCELRRRMQ